MNFIYSLASRQKAEEPPDPQQSTPQLTQPHHYQPELARTPEEEDEELKLQEFERRLRTLSVCIEEKAEENIRLTTENEKREHLLKLLTETAERERRERLTKSEASEDLARRIQLLTASLEELAQENAKLVQHIRNRPPSFSNRIPEKTGSEVGALREELEREKLVQKENQRHIRQLASRLQQEEERSKNLCEAGLEYERKLVEMEKDLRSSLKNECQRRKEAENTVSALRKKVAQLQFLLDEKMGDEQDGSSDSD